MKIIYNPNIGETNKYIELMKKSLSLLDEKIEFYSLKNGFKVKNFFKIEYVYLNWFESLDNKNIFKFYISFIIKLLLLLLLLLFNKKIIYVFHNKLPHETKNKIFSLFIIKFLIKKSKKIIIHCKESKKIILSYKNDLKIIDKIVYIPHPNYIGAYPLKNDENIKNKLDIKLKFLFIGMIRPYKNIEILIDIFNEIDDKDIIFEIAGNILDENYKEELLKKIKSSKIKVDFRFIPDEEIVEKLKQSDILILPYHLESSLNSGTVILAFSNKKTIISSNIPMLKDIKNKKEIYTYEYKNKNEEKLKLQEEIKKVILDYKRNPNILKEKGEKLYQEMSDFYSIEEISKHLKKVFE